MSSVRVVQVPKKQLWLALATSQKGESRKAREEIRSVNIRMPNSYASGE